MWNGAAGGRQEISVPRLEPKDLYDRRVRRDYARLKSYNTLLEQIYHRVYTTSQLSGNTSSVLYSVPPFILGLPKLDMEDCIVYLVWQLRQAGFQVNFTWPNMLMISWKHHEGEYLTRQNPIVQAMVPEPLPPPPPAKATGGGGKRRGAAAAAAPAGPQPPSKPTVSFNEEIDTITNGLRGSGSGPAQNNGSFFGSPPKTAEPRRAMDYEPPASFLQTLERPGPHRTQPPQERVKGNVLSDLWSS